MAIVWFIVFAVLLFIEIITVDLVTIWFAIGAVAAIMSTIWTDSLIIQLIVFAGVSLTTFILTKPFVKKLKMFSVVPTNVDRVIGQVGIVTKKIDSDHYGEVKVLGTVWTAVSNSDISEGVKVKVLSIDGVKLVVEKEED